MTRILNGGALATEIRSEVKGTTEQLLATGGRSPGLTVILVGDHPASQVYVRSKSKAAEEAGLVGRTIQLPTDVPQDRLLDQIEKLNEDSAVDGILVQLPLPAALETDRLLARIDPTKDVDGFHPDNVGRLWLDQPGFVPATPAGIIELLHRSQIPLQGRSAVIVGRSSIVGKPLAGLLLREHCTVTICHSRTRDLPGRCREADLLIAAVGQPALLGPDHVREGAVVVDVGMNRLQSAADVERLFPGDQGRKVAFERRGSVLVGDVDFTRVAARCEAITPVPGGVGPLTVAMLLVNTLRASLLRQKRADLLR